VLADLPFGKVVRVAADIYAVLILFFFQHDICGYVVSYLTAGSTLPMDSSLLVDFMLGPLLFLREGGDL